MITAENIKKVLYEQINDWSLCDGFCSNVAVMLMTYYLTDEYIDMSLEVLDSLKNEKYYCKMAVAWAIATAWAKQRDKTYAYMMDGKNTLDDWTYNKAIQKMLESYRVNDEDKVMLRKMKRA